MRATIRGAAVLALCVAGVTACAPAPPPDAGRPGTGTVEVPPAGTGTEFGITHHATLTGMVVSSAGAPLDSVTVVVQHPADPGQGSLRQTQALTGRDGRFTLPAQMFMGGSGDAAAVRVGVVVRAFGFARRYRDAAGQVPTDSATAWVTMVPRTQAPPASAAVRLTLPVR